MIHRSETTFELFSDDVPPDFGRSGAVFRRFSTSDTGRPRLPMRLMISLLCLKHAFDESVEGVADSRMLETACEKHVEFAREQGIALKQTDAKEGTYLRHKAARYAHVRQLKRMRRVIRRRRTMVGRLQRGIETCLTTLTAAIRDTLGKATRVFEQTSARKTETPKRYRWHAPEMVCITKGNARTAYEFGSKVGIATTLRGSLIVRARL